MRTTGGHGLGAVLQPCTTSELVPAGRLAGCTAADYCRSQEDLPIHARVALLAICCFLVTTLAQAAGIWFIDVPAGDGRAMHGAIWYPGAEPPRPVNFGRITLPGVRDCAIDDDKLPLVVVSHGRGGDFVGHHDTAEALVDAGFAVAAISHSGDTVTDMNRSDDLSGAWW
jgi:predicted dienelactone hydrolase